MKRPKYSDEVMFLLLTLVSCLLVSAAEAYLQVEAQTANKVDENKSSHTSESDITCWTCPNKSDNEACNNWAPDINCPLNHTVCKTIHRINTQTGQSTGVHKMCAKDTECTWDMVGCYETELKYVMECISCCNFDYCNEPVPFNHTSALELSASIASMASSVRSRHHTAVYITYLPWILVSLWTCSTYIQTLIDLLCSTLLSSGVSIISGRTYTVLEKDYLVH